MREPKTLLLDHDYYHETVAVVKESGVTLMCSSQWVSDDEHIKVSEIKLTREAVKKLMVSLNEVFGETTNNDAPTPLATVDSSHSFHG